MKATARKRVLIADTVGPHRYLDADGRPVLDPLDYSVTLVTTSRTDRPVYDAAGNMPVADITDLWATVRREMRKDPADYLVCVAEQQILDAAKIRDEWGLLGMGVPQATLFRDKLAMKRHAVRSGIQCAEIVEGVADAALQLLHRHKKVVVKPRFGTGSAGINVVQRASDLRAALDHATESKEDLVVEQWVPGDIIHIDSVVVDGRVVAATAGHVLNPTTTFTSGQGFVRSIALGSSPLLEAILAANRRTIEAFGLHNGVTHHELFMGPDRSLTFCEIAARPGGNGIVRGFKHRTGHDLYELLIRSQVGESLPGTVHVSDDLTGLLLVYGGPGRLKCKPKIPPDPDLLHIDIFDPPDGILQQPADVSQAIVQAVFRGDTAHQINEQMDAALRAVHESMVIE